jgi:septum formation protein
MADEPELILASASPRRRELLGCLGLVFTVVVSGVDETEEPPVDTLAERLAVTKAESFQSARAHVVAADTVVVLNGRIFGKPAGPGEAGEMLRALGGRWHEVRTGVAVAADGTLVSSTSVSRVLVQRLSAEEIAAYVASGRPMDKAGAYGIQDDDVPTVAALNGCYCSVMGLPLWLTRNLLLRQGLQVEEPSLERCQACPERWGQPPR